MRRQLIVSKLYITVLLLCDRAAKIWDGAAMDVDGTLLLSNRVSHCALKVRAIVSAQRELLAVLHNDAILAVKPRLHLLDPIDLNNR